MGKHPKLEELDYLFETKDKMKFCANCGKPKSQENLSDKMDFDINEKKKINKKTIIIPLIIFIIIGIITGGIFYFLVNQKDKYYLAKTVSISSDITGDEDITNTFETQYNEDGLIIEETKINSSVVYKYKYEYDENKRIVNLEIQTDDETNSFNFNYNEQDEQFIGTYYIDSFTYLELIYNKENRLVSKKYYKNGEEIGYKTYEYYENGKVKLEESKADTIGFDNSNFVNRVEYDEDGNIILLNIFYGIDTLSDKFEYEYKNGKLFSSKEYHYNNENETTKITLLEESDNNLFKYAEYDDDNKILGYVYDYYDDKGNKIKTEMCNENNEVYSYNIYQYDKLNHLVSNESYTDNKLRNKIENTWSEKNNGRILSDRYINSLKIVLETRKPFGAKESLPLLISIYPISIYF